MNVLHFRGSAFVIALPLLFAGCASLAPPATPAGATAPAAAAVRPYHETIDLSGRLSVRYQGPRQEEALHGSFLWTQTPTSTTLTLMSPLGQTIAIIDVGPQGATLKQAGQPARSAMDVDTLTAETLGWPLPVSGMRNWLQGFAVDANGRRFIATPQHSVVTTRDGWRISYPAWQEEPTGINRPRRIELSRETEQAGNVSIRIVIDTWQAP